MATIFHFTLVWSALIGLSCSGCKMADGGISFDHQGQSDCGSDYSYIRGFYRDLNKGSRDHLHLLEKAECCGRSPLWAYNPPVTVYADWWATLDGNNKWANCPSGYFLNGLYRSTNDPGWLFNIEEGRCSKPAGHPSNYGHCYTQDIVNCFDNQNVCRCKENYFVTGLYKGSCRELHCLEYLKCCDMANGPDVLDNTFKVKSRIMENTLHDIAEFANDLGYAYTSGCRASNVGEDFRRNGDKWEADRTKRCSGSNNDHRLTIAYGDWSYAIKDIKFGKPVVQKLQPQSVDSGVIENGHSTATTETIERSITSARTVTHTTTSSWSSSSELGIEITYTPPPIGGVGGSTSYKFGYESGSSTEDSKGHEQISTFKRTSTKTIPPHSKASWQLILSKTRTTIPYTATIIQRFSTELQGFLNSKNYHYQHKGSGSRPTVNYRFGNSKTPFYTALKQQSDSNSLPWLYSAMKNDLPKSKSVINILSNENRYVFTLTGKFEDIVGASADIKWGNFQRVGRRDNLVHNGNKTVNSENVKHLKTFAEAGFNDPPSPSVDPPVVNIEIPAREELEPELALGN